jgi:hypothetical protein
MHSIVLEHLGKGKNEASKQRNQALCFQGADKKFFVLSEVPKIIHQRRKM